MIMLLGSQNVHVWMWAMCLSVCLWNAGRAQRRHLFSRNDERHSLTGGSEGEAMDEGRRCCTEASLSEVPRVQLLSSFNCGLVCAMILLTLRLCSFADSPDFADMLAGMMPGRVPVWLARPCYFFCCYCCPLRCCYCSPFLLRLLFPVSSSFFPLLSSPAFFISHLFSTHVSAGGHSSPAEEARVSGQTRAQDCRGTSRAARSPPRGQESSSSG